MVTCERKGQVSVVGLNVPERRNALSVAMREALIDALNAAMDESETRAVILYGAGGHFCAGGDLGDFDLADVDAGRARMRRAQVLPRTLVAGRKPVVSAVEGSAFGAGLSLALMCDHVVVADDARLCASFVKAGLMPDYGLIWALHRRVGHALANEMLMQAREISGRNAAECGLVNEAHPKELVSDRAMAVAHDLASRPPLVIEAIKATRAVATGLEDVFAQEVEWQARLFKSEDFDEAIAAFREKHTPEFKGR